MSEKFGIAPKTGDKFSLHALVIKAEPESSTTMFSGVLKAPLYGYLTEVAKTNIKPEKDEFENLKKTLDKMKLSTSDLRDDNLGRIRGKLVLIDFDFYTHYHVGEDCWS
jgi:hypothetical protein